MKLPSIEGYKPINNRVLVKIDQRFTDIIRIKSGLDTVNLKISTIFEPEKHTITYGTVVAVPDKISFSVSEWKTDLEVAVGDTVYFSWDAVAVAYGKQGFIIEVDGDIYINVRYAQLTLKVDKILSQDLVMLNGYCLIEGLEEKDLPEALRDKKLQSDKILLSSTVKRKPSRFGRVLKVGSANRGYDNPTYSDDVPVEEGDIVCYPGFADVAVQYEMHADLIGKKNLFKIQRRFLLAVIK